jgi:hypothetical protein
MGCDQCLSAHTTAEGRLGKLTRVVFVGHITPAASEQGAVKTAQRFGNRALAVLEQARVGGDQVFVFHLKDERTQDHRHWARGPSVGWMSHGNPMGSSVRMKFKSGLKRSQLR